jgi:hypothetical protein
MNGPPLNLNLNRGLGRVLITKLYDDAQSITPDKRDALVALQLLETHNWVVPTKSEIVACL